MFIDEDLTGYVGRDPKLVQSVQQKKKAAKLHQKNASIDRGVREGGYPEGVARSKMKVEAASLYRSAKGYVDSIKASKQKATKHAQGVLARPLATAGNGQRQDFLMYVPIAAQPIQKSRSKVVTAKRASVTKILSVVDHSGGAPQKPCDINSVKLGL